MISETKSLPGAPWPDWLKEVWSEAADAVTATVCRFNPKWDPADAHEDIREDMIPSFDKLADLMERHKRLREGVDWYFSRRFGLSSEAMFREAMGFPQDRRWPVARPWDKGDSEGVEETFAAAPGWMQALMQPRLDWYREIARLEWPVEAPEREAVAS